MIFAPAIHFPARADSETNLTVEAHELVVGCGHELLQSPANVGVSS